jgi:dipeptidase
MCDTFLATKTVTKNHSHLIFGKNSDREPNEAQAVVHFPRKKNKEDRLQVTYINIPQVKETYEVYLSKPFHMWGAEMGVNEYGVVIGNEAIFSKVALPKKNDGLTGMDLLRLALERSKTKDQALNTITSLLEEYGQDACSGYYDRDFFYHNSFLIGDSEGAILLETVDRQWVAKKLKGFRSISNGLTIGSDYDYSSKDVKDFASKNGWLKPGKDFSFKDAYSDWFFTKMSKCSTRQGTTSKMGNMFSQTEGLGIKEAMDILRSHNSAHFKPNSGDMGSVCLHATGMITPSQTTGSMVVEINEQKRITVWLTGSSASCLSLYKPFYFGNNFLDEDQHTQPSNVLDDSFWWQAERFHRLALADYDYAQKMVFKESQESERHWRRKDAELQGKKTSSKQLQEFSEHAWNHHKEILKIWTRDLASRGKSPSLFSPLYNMFWNDLNKRANIN